MIMETGFVVSDCADLSVGDDITVWKEDRFCHAGTVTDVLPHMGLLWIREAPLNERRLLDMGEIQVRRTSQPPAPEPAAA